MPLTIEQLVERRSYIGGSDVAAILGLSPWKTPLDVYLQKTGQVEEKVHPSEAAEIGDRMEPMLIAWARDRIDPTLELTPNERFMHENGVFSAQIDGWLPDLGVPIEAKTAGLKNRTFHPDDDGWGDDGTDEIPMHYVAQVNFQMLVTGASEAHVAAFLGGGVGPRFYHLPRNERLVDAIAERCERFWRDHVEAGVPPEGRATLPILKDRIREPSKLVALDEDLGREYAALKEQAALVKKAVELKQEELLTALGDAEIGDFGWGQVTYKADKRGRRSLRIKEKN